MPAITDSLTLARDWLKTADCWYYSRIEARPAWQATVFSAPADAEVTDEYPGTVLLRLEPRWRNTRVFDAASRELGTGQVLPTRLGPAAARRHTPTRSSPTRGRKHRLHTELHGRRRPIPALSCEGSGRSLRAIVGPHLPDRLGVSSAEAGKTDWLTLDWARRRESSRAPRASPDR
jgi:hypothetical protein